MARFWNFIRNKAAEGVAEEIELRIEGDIIDNDYAWLYEWCGIPAASPNAFREELNQFKGQDIIVWIDSYGGSVFAGAGLYNALMEHKRTGAKVTAKITKAMSAATIPMMAADIRLMTPGGVFMMHNPLTEVKGYASDLRKAADVLDVVKETIINAYQLGSGKSRSKISSLMEEETYMDARAAIKEGFATGMLYTGDDQKGQMDDIVNFTFNRLAITNAAGDSIKKLYELAQNIQSQSASQLPTAEPQKADENKNDKEGEPPMYNTVEELRNACPDLVKQIEDTAREEGSKQERTRIQNIEKISRNISADLVNKAKFEQPKDAKELAFEALQADNNKGADYLENVKKDAKDSGADGVKSEPDSLTDKKDAENKAASEIAAAINKRRGIV